jgi:6-pyruvoyltetrahydropterin/6-carboxytetrahydropterin synthase
MRQWTVSKQIDFCFGHRVYTQELNTDFSIDGKCKCRHLHGHNGVILISCSGDHLEGGMVTDFKHFNWLKKFVDDVLDHKFIIGREDPLFHKIVPHEYNHLGLPDKYPWKSVLLDDYDTNAKIIDPNYYKFLTGKHMQDVLEGFVSVDFVPTSENLCAWFYDLCKHKMSGLGVKVESITFKETEKTSCTFTAEGDIINK